MKKILAALIALSAMTAAIAPASAGFTTKDLVTFDGPAYGPKDIVTFDGPGFGPSDIRGFDGPAHLGSTGVESR